ncbi:MAG: hypothetical protein F6J93_23250 [Oscillatoria sp. SIO1A7]|nr:hypothetical protein [Oscillatoria sp. SIO1A7]
MRSPTEPVTLMEPMLPSEGSQLLEDLAADLIARNSTLNAQVPKTVAARIGDLVRAINCYDSNLIEGHHTHLRDINRALVNDFSTQPEKRFLQLEAKAHIEVQELIDKQEEAVKVVSGDYLRWIHGEFCNRLPEELLRLKRGMGHWALGATPAHWALGIGKNYSKLL